MIRRRFLQLVALSGAGTLAPFEALASGKSKTVIYQVRGFTCITCAVGLDTMLGKQKGVLSSQSTYPEGKVTVRFDPDSAAESSIRAFINDTGFTVVNVHEV
jgi:copper chaperone CopZ